jgi:hypothetical protein
MLLYLHYGFYMFRQNNAFLREQLGSFLSYFNVSMLGGKSRSTWYRPMCQFVLKRTVMDHYQVHTRNTALCIAHTGEGRGKEKKKNVMNFFILIQFSVSSMVVFTKLPLQKFCFKRY